MYRLFYDLRYHTWIVKPDGPETFHHTDRNRLRKIPEPTPNPTALAAQRTPK